jgi:rhamnosyltransferase
MNDDIIAAVILYNPDILDVLKNVASYAKHVNKVYVFDNSDIINNHQDELSKAFDNLSYFSFNENKGIGFGVNYIIGQTESSKSKWLLIMDQDSSFGTQFIKYLNLIGSFSSQNVTLFCPMYPNESHFKPQFYSSGSFLKLDDLRSLGGLNEELFIDEIDGDLFYRIKKNGFNVKKIDSILLEHKLGNTKSKYIFGKKIISDNHSSLRKYYIARNRIYLSKKRPELFYLYFIDSFRKFILMLLVENNKLEKLKFICLGIFHGLINKMGKLSR